MRGAREVMYPLCCIPVDSTATRSRAEPEPPRDPVTQCNAGAAAGSEAVRVAGVLYKWTNYGRGWRARWFALADGVLSYSKIGRPEDLLTGTHGARLIGDAPARLFRASSAKPQKAGPVIYLKISSFRESKSDDRKFYVFSPTKTLHLRTDSREDRVAWIEALVSAKNVFTLRTLSQKIPLIQNDVLFSTEKLRVRMQMEGVSEALIKECEQIMVSEFSEFQRQLKLRYAEHLSFIGTYQQLEEVNGEDETEQIHDGQLQLFKHDFSCSDHGKYSEYSTTESSDDVEKPEFDDLSDEEEPSFFDTADCFSDTAITCASPVSVGDNTDQSCNIGNHSSDLGMTHVQTAFISQDSFPHIEGRKKLPEPIEKERSVSLWSIIKDNVGKDLTRVCLPVYFNEPLSSLQKCCEELEYSYLLDRAYEYGKMGNSLMRVLNVAAFAVSGYASSDGRPCKPFNPLLGETYEAIYPEKGIRFFSEKVSHHPMLIGCHCEGKGWKFWGDSNLRSKFWGRSIQLDPVGVLTLEFDDGQIFQWSKVTTTIYNLILGKVYCDHHGIMNIQGNSQYSCKLKFKEQSLLDRNPRQVQGFVEDVMGAKVATLAGKWDDSMYYAKVDDISRMKHCNLAQHASLLWKRNKAPPNPTRYNLTSFAITLNELTSELKDKLPPTDSRLRSDQRYLENGEYEKANAEKQRLEKRQRMSRKLQENGWQPRWFRKNGEDGTYRYLGGYWEAREQKNWDGCPNIFGEFMD